MKTIFFFCILPCVALALTSDPVGALRQSLPGNSDTFVSLPLHRPALVETRLASRSGNQLTFGVDLPSLPAGGAYVLVMSGPLEGAVLPVSSVDDRVLTVDSGSEDLSSLQTENINGTGNGDILALIPYWTLDTLFSGGRGLNATSNPLLPKTQILLFDPNTVGTNQSVSASYYYYSGAAMVGPGWYKFGVTTQLAGATTLPPYRSFIIRQTATATELLIPGQVQMAGYRVPLATLAANTDQDNFVAVPLPVPTTLGDTALMQSGAFAVTTNIASRKDELLRFDNAAIGKNKAASATYYYYQGTALQGTGWYKMGDNTRLADTDIFSAGEAFVIRKRRTSSPLTQPWTGIPSYLQ